LWSLIELGAQNSAGLAVLWVLGAGFVGMATIRFAGAQVLSRLQAAQREGALQQQLVASDMALAIAGLLLIVPGLISDALAVLVLIRPARHVLGRIVAARWSKGASHGGAAYMHRHAEQDAFHARQAGREATQQDDGVTLEGEFQELDREAQPLPHQESRPPDSGSS
jgi:UPF0716 protein FxsA